MVADGGAWCAFTAAVLRLLPVAALKRARKKRLPFRTSKFEDSFGSVE